jgi:alpha-beta hydrolase superfamily lysophospholipase
MIKKKSAYFLKRLIWLFAIIFVLINIVASFHAYKFTHFSVGHKEKVDPKKITFFEKIELLFLGVDMPRPENYKLPTQPFEVIELKSNKKIACWLIKTKKAKGTMIIFHGYGGEKSSMLDKSDEFLKLGYNTLLVDFIGSGNSEGNQTTIGFKEAQNVKTCFQFLKDSGEQNIYLFGTSMGAAAIMKAINDDQLKPKAIILECPFGSMYKTTYARFKALNVPTFPMVGILVFWGGVENGFWAFNHKPINYAKNIGCPTLLLYGEKDERVSRQEIDEIYSNLKGKKILKTYPMAGHVNYLIDYREKWLSDVNGFLLKN